MVLNLCAEICGRVTVGLSNYWNKSTPCLMFVDLPFFFYQRTTIVSMTMCWVYLILFFFSLHAFSVSLDLTITMAHNLLTCEQNMYRWFMRRTHWNSRPVQRQCQMRAMYWRQSHESSQLEEWPICRAHHSALPCFYCSGDVGRILDDGVCSKASVPSSGQSLHFDSGALLTRETDGGEATGIK